MNDIFVDEKTGEVMMNSNADVIYLPKEVFDSLQQVISEEIDKEI